MSFLAEFQNPFVGFLTCQIQKQNETNEFTKWITLLTLGTIITTIFVTFGKKSSNQVQTSTGFNTSARNKALATTSQYILVAFLGTFGGGLQFLTPMEKVLENSWLILPKYFSLPFISGVIIPALFYLNKKEARKHFLDMFLA